MRIFLAYIAANLVALACVIIAGYLATHAIPGWGYFLFCGVLCAATTGLKSNSDSGDESRCDCSDGMGEGELMKNGDRFICPKCGSDLRSIPFAN